MVCFTMDGPARDRVLKLMDEKDRIESEIRDQTAILESNRVGMHDTLVDDQGFPRNDIDVYKVRHARHRIICLQNDHKNLMKMIERGLAEVHADLLGSSGEQRAPAQVQTTSTNGHMNGFRSNSDVKREPFAVVTYVDDGSPAQMAGLSNNDKIIQFGSLTHNNFTDMTQIFNIVTHSVGQLINVQVQRDDLVVCINLTPRPWAQPGLLGCHIQRIS